MNWMMAALKQLKAYALRRKQEGREFLAEDFVVAYKQKNLPQPPDPRSFGLVFIHAQNAGLIKKVGYSKARTSHGGHKCKWTMN